MDADCVFSEVGTMLLYIYIYIRYTKCGLLLAFLYYLPAGL